MPATELKDLQKNELGILLYGERRFLTATRKPSREVEDPKVRERLENNAVKALK
ncbi:MAG: hypothetical protein WD737_12810 [Gemmatimonadota bacterium]